MRAKSQKRKKRRRRGGQGIIIVISAVIVVIFAGVAGYRILDRADKQTDKKVGTDSTEVSGKLVINTDVTVRDRIEKRKKEEAERNVDRSQFAVQQGSVPGSDVQTEEKVVYLTLDDGPSQNTATVLDILDKYNVKATFFVTNEMPGYIHMIKEAYDRGHTIGLHTYSHDYASVYASQEAYFRDLDAIGEVVKEQIGYVPCFIRFPGGSSNTVSRKYTSGIMTALSQEVQNRGYQYYDWNASSGDGGVLSTEELVNNATGFSENNIVLLSHDSSAKQTTVEALPGIIEHYQAQGYEFRALDRNTYVPHHGINN